ncbi:hypothetical protein R5R35_003499 [Gryllus longicercus]|uniref:non-specific serine/threonine protein kinase n=1 Tax=Gryllus longicercus TaxID=2509291 RepID=A0AAN9VXY0_9ORTH
MSARKVPRPPGVKRKAERPKTSTSIPEEKKEPEDILLSDNNDEDEQEDPQDYGLGGYCHIRIGDILNDRYIIIRKLGWGHFSTVWLCYDKKDKRYVAMKVVKSASHYRYAAQDEVKMLQNVYGSSSSNQHHRIIQLLDSFEVPGDHGSHVCMVFDVHGVNLLKLLISNNYQGLPLRSVKSIIKQVLEGLDYLHTKCNIVHTDIKPENILLCVGDDYPRKLALEATECLEQCMKGGLKFPRYLVNTSCKRDRTINPLFYKESQSQNHSYLLRKRPKLMDSSEMPEICGEFCNEKKNYSENVPVDAASIPKEEQIPDPRNEFYDVKVRIGDLGNACYLNDTLPEDAQTREYRSLEVLLGARYGTPADIWSVACLAFELATGDFLFKPQKGDGYSKDEDHVAHIMELLGNIPEHIKFSGRYSKDFFTNDGHLRNIKIIKPCRLEEVLKTQFKWRSEDAKDFTDFLRPMLEFDPQKRATAAQCLQHSWLRS